jgi:hypothetical protein
MLAAKMTDNAAPRHSGQWKKGQSGNPAGMSKGTRHRATMLAEKLMEDDAENTVQAVVNAAKAGDPTAMRLCIERLVPVRFRFAVRLPARLSFAARNSERSCPISRSGALGLILGTLLWTILISMTSPAVTWLVVAVVLAFGQWTTLLLPRIKPGQELEAVAA